jgi:hypothetical protein
MLGNTFTRSFHVPGTLAANIVIVFTVLEDCKLVGLSAVGSNANSGLLTLGNSSTADAYLTSLSIGDSDTPVTKSAKGDFVGSQYPHIAAGIVFKATLDFDGAGGTATHDFTLDLVFLEG